MTTYTPGQFARITVTDGCKKVRAVRTSDDDWAGDDGYTYSDNEVTNVVQLITLDLAAANPDISVDKVTETVIGTLKKSFFISDTALAKQIEAQTKPPRIPEPGLWGVVEAKIGGGVEEYRFMRSDDTLWHTVDCSRLTAVSWDRLTNPVLVRPGIEDAS